MYLGKKKEKISTLEEGLFVTGLMVTMAVSMFCLVILFIGDLRNDIGFFYSFLPVFLGLSFYLGTKTIRLFYGKRVRINKPILLEAEHILELIYPRDKWIDFKKEEYLKKKRKKQRVNLYFILGGLTFIILLSIGEPAVGVIFLYFTLFFCIPMGPILKQRFDEEYFNNIELEEEEYVVRIYRTGVTINNWFVPYNWSYVNGSYISLESLELIDENSNQYLEFKSTSKTYYTPTLDDHSSGEQMAKGSLKLPLLDSQNVNVKKLKKILLL